MNNFSPDEFLSQATCAVLREGQIVGTAWLVSHQGHLLTAGHVLGTAPPLADVKVQFVGDVPRAAQNVEWVYDEQKHLYFAVLKLSGFTDRRPLPLSLAKEVQGQFRLCGYGTRMKERAQLCSKGEFLGSMYIDHSSSVHLFRLRSSDLGQEGNSGGAVFSDDKKAVVGIQTEAALARIGPEADVVLAMPLYRVAQVWEPLKALAERATGTFSEDGQVVVNDDPVHPPRAEFDSAFSAKPGDELDLKPQADALSKPASADFFVAGGTLYLDTPSYVRRSADEKLFRFALAGEYCHVLAASQLGKSSLMTRTAKRLQQNGTCRTATIDLSGFGTTQVSMDQWYQSFLQSMAKDLTLSVNLEAWWQKQPGTPVKRFSDFLHDVVLSEIDTQVVIFIDEIGCALSLDFSDDFFAAIRFMYNNRAKHPKLKRLAFVLLGAVSPSDLVKDHTRSPFNIGQEVVLRDFSKGEVAVLQRGLDEKYPGQGQDILTWIYEWTEGHLYLTQRLCKAVVDADQPGWSNQQIDELVDQLFLSNDRREVNSRFIRKHILTHPRRNQLLAIYEKVCKGENVPDKGRDYLKNSLKLSGVVKEDGGYLKVRNNIYKEAFDLEWVQENTGPQPLPLPLPLPTPKIKPVSSLKPTDFFVAGGTLNPDTPSYIKREADDELVQLVLSGSFVYVLAASPLGKSSLMARTAHFLEQNEKCRTAMIDLAGFGTTEISMDQWYFAFISEIAWDLHLSVDLEAWWQEQPGTPVKRFSDFLRDVLLSEIDTQVVIFVDEIGYISSLDFSDDFFAAIRFMYNDRARRPELKRLTFVLLGVASPSDLMKDHTRSPFNIGQEVVLRDFSKGEVAVLQRGLDEKYPGQGQDILARIYQWTEGHPYLTQKLCKAVVDADEQGWSNQQIDELVNQLFLSNDRKEINLQLIRYYILNHPQRNQLLATYERVYKGEDVPDEGRDYLKNSLKLSGVVKEDGGYLKVRNHIYKKAFDLGWVRENTLYTPEWKLVSFVRQIIDNVFRKNRERWYKAVAAVTLLVGVAWLALSLWFAITSLLW